MLVRRKFVLAVVLVVMASEVQASSYLDIYGATHGTIYRTAAAGGGFHPYSGTNLAPGAILAGGSREMVAAIEAYASHLGLAFQIIDDILDVEGSAEELGKTAGKDAAASKPTYPMLYGLRRSRELAAEAVSAAQQTLADADLHGPLREIANWVVTRNH